MATLNDTLETKLLLTGGAAFSAGLGDAAKGFSGVADASTLATKANDLFKTVLDGLMNPLTLVTAGLATLAATFKAASDATNEFAASERILVPLAIELRNLGNAFPVDQAVAFANQMQNVTGVSHRTIERLEQMGASFGLNAQQIEKLSRTSLDIGVAKQIDPTLVLRRLFQASRGRPQGLVALGIDPNKVQGDLHDINNLVDQLEKTFGGTAEAFRNTLPGTMDAFASATQSLNEAWGRFFSPYTIGFMNAMTFLTKGLTDLLNAGAEYWRLPGATDLGKGNRPDISLKGDPEQTALLDGILQNTGKTHAAIARVIGGSGEVAMQSWKERDRRIAFGA